jgi:hypothetical protein
MKHIVVVRANFQDDQLFKKYLKVAKETFFPGINSQINKNFTLCFTVNEKHKEIIKNLVDNKINTIFFKDNTEIRRHLQKEFFEIQTRHDFDDWMRENYIQKIQLEWNKTKTLQADVNTMLIQSQPNLYLFNTKTIRPMKTRYSNSFVSMHLSLCQIVNKHFIFEQMHHKMNLITKKIKLLPNGYTRLVIHNNNKLSNINS